MTHEEKRLYLIKTLLAEQPRYRNTEIPADARGQRNLLRSLMNIRPPQILPGHVIQLQDEYLTACAEEKGVVFPAEIPSVREALGSKRPFAEKLALWQGDITRLAADAIVNAANSQMLGCFIPMHTCIDNCIHTYAGVQLRAECNRQMQRLREQYGKDYEQPTAVPMLTDAYNLPAKKIVHIVGPIVSGRLTPVAESELAVCYQNTLDLCAENGLRSVAFCCISTGVFGFPQERAAEIAVENVTTWLATHERQTDRVIFNVFTDKDRDLYAKLLRQ